MAFLKTGINGQPLESHHGPIRPAEPKVSEAAEQLARRAARNRTDSADQGILQRYGAQPQKSAYQKIIDSRNGNGGRR